MDPMAILGLFWFDMAITSDPMALTLTQLYHRIAAVQPSLLPIERGHWRAPRVQRAGCTVFERWKIIFRKFGSGRGRSRAATR